MLTHKKIEEYSFSIVPTSGDLVASHDALNLPIEEVMKRAATNPEWYNLLVASQLLYKQLTRHYVALEMIINQIHGMPNSDSFVSIFEQLQNSILSVQVLAREGVDNVKVGVDSAQRLL